MGWFNPAVALGKAGILGSNAATRYKLFSGPVGQGAPCWIQYSNIAMSSLLRRLPFVGIASSWPKGSLTRRIMSLFSGLPTTKMGPFSPPLKINSFLSSRKPPFVLVALWQA